MLSRWEKVSGAIMDRPTVGSAACVARGKSGHKKAAREGRLDGGIRVAQTNAPANHFW